MGLKKKKSELQEAAATSQAVYQCSGRGHVHGGGARCMGEGTGAWGRGQVHGGRGSEITGQQVRYAKKRVFKRLDMLREEGG